MTCSCSSDSFKLGDRVKKHGSVGTVVEEIWPRATAGWSSCMAWEYHYYLPVQWDDGSAMYRRFPREGSSTAWACELEKA